MRNTKFGQNDSAARAAKKNNRIEKKIVATALLLVFVCLMAAGLFSCRKGTSSYVARNVELKEDGNYKILMLTDLHFINTEVTSDSVVADLVLRDEWVKTSVTAIINEAKPDMLVVTGDSVFTHSMAQLITGTSDNYAAFEKAAQFIDSFNIPWAFVFGNHDEEGELLRSTGSKEEAKKALGELLTSDEVKNCLFTAGPEDITGCGNYVINVLDHKGNVNTSLVFFDSGSCLTVYDESQGKYVTDEWKYEYVHDDQLDWYERAIGDISAIEGRTVPSIVFQHIPIPAYREALNAYLDALAEMGENWRDTINAQWVYGTERKLDTSIGEVTYYGGVCNKENQQVCCPFIGTFGGVTFDGGHEFERILKLGSTKYVFCGHDHRNTFSFSYKGVRLTYGMSIDYSAVGLVPEKIWPNQNIYDETEQRGGTLITLKEDGTTTVAQIPFTENLYRKTVAERGVAK